MVGGTFFERNLKYFFPLPALLFILIMMVFPVAYTLGLSFSNWTLTSGAPIRFAGFRSYSRIFSEPRFLAALGRTFSFTALALAGETILGVAVAIFLNREFYGKGMVKFALLLPLVATPVAIGIVWNLFYDPTIGFANYIISLLGGGRLAWVASEATVIPSLVLVDVWQWTPMITLIVLAGLASLSPEPYESARVDGAGEFQILSRITLPMVAPTIFTAVILRTVDSLKTFDIIYAMTGGGPGYSSETLNVMAFKYSFEYFRMGQASVILVVLFFLVLLFSLGIMRLRTIFDN